MDYRHLPFGIYEQVASADVLHAAADMQSSSSGFAQLAPLDPDAALQMLNVHLRETLAQYSGSTIDSSERLNDIVSLYNRLIEVLRDDSPNLWQQAHIPTPAQQLVNVGPAESATSDRRPLLSLNTSALFTGSNSFGLSVADELRREILAADRIDLLVSFIKQSGLNLIMDALEEFTKTRALRVVTTTYMGVTDPEAVERLSKLPNTTIRVSYDNRRTRLHAKAYLFSRDSGYSTAFIGSSNLSSAAVTDGLEWNIRTAAKETPTVWAAAEAAFESYWHSPQFHEYDTDVFADFIAASRTQPDLDVTGLLSAPPLHPFAYQQTILDRLEAERVLHGRHKNLVVAATGTGKTAIAAFDFKRFVAENPGSHRLLFVAHREEILLQARDTFRNVLEDYDFGSLGVGGSMPRDKRELFVSIQTLNSRNLTSELAPDYYDYIVIDEFHHAAAPSYQKLLSHFVPQVLLGLTATPERMDGISVQDAYFDGQIAAEIRLPEAINRQLLVPFHYYCIDDQTDLSQVKFTAGSYDIRELENLYVFDDKRVQLIRESLGRYLPSASRVKALGFCVSVRHAEFMADRFRRAGLKAVAIHGGTDKEVRARAIRQLATGHVNYVFSVDIFNEGIDIPEVDTVLFLRPTESLTIFLQQLGRGLRLSEGKTHLTVLDYIGQANNGYQFDRKFRALVLQSGVSIRAQVKDLSFVLPRDCAIVMNEVVQQRILDNISTAVTAAALRRKIQDYRLTGGSPFLSDFLAANDDVSPADMYRRMAPNTARTFASLYAADGRLVDRDQERLLARVATMDSRAQLELLRDITEGDQPPASDASTMLLNMIYYAVNTSTPESTARNWLDALLSEKWFASELADLVTYQLNHLSFVSKPLDLGFPHGLELHATYPTSREILAGLGYYTEISAPSFREGVIYIPDIRCDAFFVTLDKSAEHRAESTRYKDYAVSESVFHWQSQNRTAPESAVGQRYQRHDSEGSRILLFVRETEGHPFCALGQGHYQSHRGSRPMSILWRLETPIPESILAPALAMDVA